MKDLKRPAPGWATGLSFCLWAMTDIVSLLRYAVIFDIITRVYSWREWIFKDVRSEFSNQEPGREE